MHIVHAGVGAEGTIEVDSLGDNLCRMRHARCCHWKLRLVAACAHRNSRMRFASEDAPSCSFAVSALHTYVQPETDAVGNVGSHDIILGRLLHALLHVSPQFGVPIRHVLHTICLAGPNVVTAAKHTRADVTSDSCTRDLIPALACSPFRAADRQSRHSTHRPCSSCSYGSVIITI